MEIISEGLLGIEIRSIFLIKSDTWLNGMYRGSIFIGLCWNYEREDALLLLEAGNNLFPKNLKDWEEYEYKYSDRVSYHPRSLDDHFFLPKETLEEYRAG
ncbi:hypothetical protein [Tenacibaculum dicentrarchi]|uniref:hypothetical protein n=1 Tax=Tenacibaculum dicentrarchi TaxID=669041 RepID=UPI00351758D3